MTAIENFSILHPEISCRVPLSGQTNDLSFSLSYIITTIVRRTRHKLAYKNGQPGLKCLRISLNAFYKLSDSTMSETAVIDVLSHGTMFFAHTFYDSTYQSELCICMEL